jgi:hypothetical protein
MNSLIKLTIFFFSFALLPLNAEAARLWSSGCEFQSDTPGASLQSGLEFTGIGTTTAEFRNNTTIKHSGASSCRMAATADGRVSGQVQYLSAAAGTDLYYRFYFYITTAPTEDASIFSVWDRGIDSWEGGLILETDRQLHWADDAGVTDGQGTTVLNTGQWYRIEVNYDALDQVLVYIDGVQEFNSGTHDGDSVDDLYLGICNDDGIACSGDNIAQGEWYFDDIAINNTSGTAQTGLPGAGNIVYMQPDSAGDANGCSAGDVTSIDEITPDDATTICVLDADSGGDILDVNTESSSNAGIDSYDTITLVQTGIRSAGATALSHTWNLRLKSASGGTTSDGSTRAIASSAYRTNGGVATAGQPSDYTLTSYTDPTTTTAWTPTGTNSLDNMQIGANAVDGNPDINVSALWALVEYTDGANPVSPPQSSQVNFTGGQTTITSGTLIIP